MFKGIQTKGKNKLWKFGNYSEILSGKAAKKKEKSDYYPN